MNTKYCKDCIKEIEKEASKCPYCRTPQLGINRILNSPLINIPLFVIFFSVVFWGSSYFADRQDVYMPSGFDITENNIQQAMGKCAQKIQFLGEIYNSNAEAYEDFHFNIEAYDEKGKLVEAFDEKHYGLIVPANTKLKFKLENSKSSIEELPSKFKVKVVKATKRDILA
ncbi:RING finger protein [Teredinibacter haidensis]|uniref:RING finger protein n=1 Tax=Teredinibacter haidensis TaxID=2731755 RepID=UPI00094891F2|nr:RING finger protein [Teredinibacter haidensis]